MATESRKLWWIIIALLIGMSALAATNIYILMQTNAPAESEAEEGAESSEPVEQMSLFVKIAPFTVNLQPDSYGNRLLYTGVTLQVGDEQTQVFLEERMPQVRSRLLSLFSGREANELISPDGKEQLRNDVLEMLRTPMSPSQPELALQDVLFTEFIVQ